VGHALRCTALRCTAAKGDLSEGCWIGMPFDSMQLQHVIFE
jgi:hypothetical protein